MVKKLGVYKVELPGQEPFETTAASREEALRNAIWCLSRKMGEPNGLMAMSKYYGEFQREIGRYVSSLEPNPIISEPAPKYQDRKPKQGLLFGEDSLNHEYTDRDSHRPRRRTIGRDRAC